VKKALGVTALLLVIAAAILWFVPSGDYILLPDKAQPVAPLITVAGKHRRDRDRGAVYFLAVIVRKATLFERLFPSIRTGATLVPESAVKPPGVSDKAQHQIEEREMVRSQDVAAALAERAAGYKVRIRLDGARISAVIPGMPATKALRATEVITAVDGKAVQTPDDLRRLIRARKPGDRVRLTVRSTSGLRTVELRTVPDSEDRKRPVVGVIVDQAGGVQLPVRVNINPGAVVGPSAGLPFALEIMEKLGRNVDRGYRIAATGELELDGRVAPIGGVEQKAIEAKQSHVDILLVPAGENAAVARRYAGPVRVIPVHSFQQALHKLATLPPKA
jgi:Lon-like protease